MLEKYAKCTFESHESCKNMSFNINFTFEFACKIQNYKAISFPTASNFDSFKEEIQPKYLLSKKFDQVDTLQSHKFFSPVIIIQQISYLFFKLSSGCNEKAHL